MRDAERVHKINCGCNLMGNIACSSLRNNKLTLVQVRKQIAADKQLHNDLNVILVLKNVIKTDNARMLQLLDHFNLSFQQLQIFQV